MGAVDDAKGRAKEAVGDVTGDDKLKKEGKLDRGKGKVKDAVDNVADRVKGK
ncbi:MAG: CsbD family protein [Acidimicrobiales bacterium]